MSGRGNIGSYINGFSIADWQPGFVALINGKIIGLEALSLPKPSGKPVPN